MKKPRKMVAVLLVAMALTLSVATPAHADAGDAVEEWASYVCVYFGWC